MFRRGTLRLFARAFLCLLSPIALTQTQPVFPLLHYDPYAVSTPLVMTEGDLNGDGVTDTLYAAASSPAGSSLLTSAPRSATGASLASIAAGTVPCTANSLLLADLNKDNKLDAIITCNENTVAVLAGNGDGTFQAATTYAVTSAAKAVAVDINADTCSIALATPKVYGSGSPFPQFGSSQLMIGDPPIRYLLYGAQLIP